MPFRLLLLLAVIAASGVGWAGCALSGGSSPSKAVRATGFAWSEAQLEAYWAVAEDAAEVADVVALAEAFETIEGVQPVLDGTFLLPAASGGPAGVAAYVPGRWPDRREELVVVGTLLPEAKEDAASTAALLALASAYAEARRYHLAPARTVLFAVWAPPGDGAPDGLQAFLQQPTWARDRIRDVYVVGDARSVRSSGAPQHDAHGPGAEAPRPAVTVLPAGTEGSGSTATTRALALRLREAIRPAVMAMPASPFRHESR